MAKQPNVDWLRIGPQIWDLENRKSKEIDEKVAMRIGCRGPTVARARHRYGIEPKGPAKRRRLRVNKKQPICGVVFGIMAVQCQYCQGIKPLSGRFFGRGKNNQKIYYDYKCKECYADARRKEALKIKTEVFQHYGGLRCVCCGEREPACLLLHHKQYNGNAERGRLFGFESTNRAGTRFYYQVRKEGYPDDLEVLCQNCHWMKHHNNGACPHGGA